jgi:hypothetical protein
MCNTKTYPLVFVVNKQEAYASKGEAPSPVGGYHTDPANPREVLTLMGITTLNEIANAKVVAHRAIKALINSVEKHAEALDIYSKSRTEDMPDMDDVIASVKQYKAFFHDFMEAEGIFADPNAEAPAPAPSKAKAKVTPEAKAAAAAVGKKPAPPSKGKK